MNFVTSGLAIWPTMNFSTARMSRLLVPAVAGYCLLLVGCGSDGNSVPSVSQGLAPQTYTWYPERSPSGPVLVFVSLKRQEAVVYRNGVRIGRAAVSTGRAGHSTPTGVFQILQKDIDHRSSTYGDAPMPYMQRLTWDGVALHAGFNPGHPDSHGCVRLPKEFAQKLYGVTERGGTVVVSNSATLPSMSLTEGVAGGGGGAGTWDEMRPGVATSLVVSIASQVVDVYQNGKKVGHAPLEMEGPARRFKGEEVFIYKGNLQWYAVEGTTSYDKLRKHVRVPDAFLQKTRSVLHPGTTMVVTSEPMNARGGQSRELLSGN